MTDHKPTRRELMRPAQLLGLAFGAAVFGGVVTMLSMGFFEQRNAGQMAHAFVVGIIVAGVIFIVTLVVMSLLLLAVDPAEVTRTIDRPVLLADDDRNAGDGGPDAPATGAGDPPQQS